MKTLKGLISFRTRKKNVIEQQAAARGVSVSDLMNSYVAILSLIEDYMGPESRLIIQKPMRCDEDIAIPFHEVLGKKDEKEYERFRS